jgi:RNase H
MPVATIHNASLPGDENPPPLKIRTCSHGVAPYVIQVTTFPTWHVRLAPLEIHTDSKYVIEGPTLHLPNWDDIGWIAVQNAPLFKRAAFLLRRRTATTHFRWVRGHSGDHGNEESDRLAKEGARKATPDELDLELPAEFSIQGAKLSVMTQALAYKGIRRSKMEKTPPVSPALLQKIREAIIHFNGQYETDATIWKSLRKPKNTHPAIPL